MKNLVQRWLSVLVCAILVSSLFLTGCSNTSDAQGNQSNLDNYVPRLNGIATVEMKIKGATTPILIEINGNDAPITGGNFVDLVERGVYNGLVFHRVISSPDPFVAQGGDPKGNGTGGFIDPETKQERRIPLEIKLKDDEKPTYGKALGRQGEAVTRPVVLKHLKGAIAMARSQPPDSASSQFYFALSDLDFLDGDYAVFGYVKQGMETVEKIKQGDRIESAKVVSGSENLKK
ncbi:peptidylprolyl isomerase [Aphanothece sacrum]|uniref:peptidylprolyl isomerase n=1 Tax=Aphanothece sacrum FPU1 TaxID=1920663 RepID=A0A401ICW6_APHSA|nr:peptidylprolyl isomerase [Aphanothece sacrum]GBF79143.1 peptidyl-prolyl cis-trans isomerase cyclophilin type [Aphanothece sacrum FPU1]GBF86532.1 peptidyl-prolyl cis-trans isomerase [Aphanothece sacrum FPU3]